MKILLVSKEKTFLVDRNQKIFHTQFGTIDLTNIKKYGQKIKTNTGKEFTAVEPTIIDMLSKCRRGPQIVTPKDAAQIAAVTGLANGWKCLDLGGGSGFLSIMIGNMAKPGKVVTYEKKKENAKIIWHNIKFCGLGNIIVKNKDASKFSEKNLDLITMDVTDAEKLVKKCHAALRKGGWICTYSPHIEQQQKVIAAIRKCDFFDVRTIENIQRSWTSLKGYTHPKPMQVVHTGFLTFARKT